MEVGGPRPQPGSGRLVHIGRIQKLSCKTKRRHAVDYVNGKEFWDSSFNGSSWTRFMDYWQIDRAVVQTSKPGFDGLVAYKLADEMDLQLQASAKDEFKKRIMRNKQTKGETSWQTQTDSMRTECREC